MSQSEFNRLKDAQGQDLTTQYQIARDTSLEIASSLGILVPGMEITVGEQAFQVLDKAHEHVGPGWFYVAPYLPEEARNEVQIAPVQVLFHPPTAEWGKTSASTPIHQALQLAQDLLKK